MQKEIQVRLTPSESAHGPSLLKAISQITGEAESSITGYQILKKSIDARSRQNLGEPYLDCFHKRTNFQTLYRTPSFPKPSFPCQRGHYYWCGPCRIIRSP